MPAKFLKDFLKKSLPNVAIPGISPLRAATTLLAIGNYLSSRHFQRSRPRTGIGLFNVGFYGSSSGEKEGDGTGPIGREKAGASDNDRAGAIGVCDGAGTTDRETIRNRDD
jgi:hypothetical protein